MAMGDPDNPKGMIWTDSAGWVPNPQSSGYILECERTVTDFEIATLRGELRAAQTEIDRLRAYARHERDLGAEQVLEAISDEVWKLRGDNERLRAEVEQWRKALEDLIFAVDNDKQVYPCGGVLRSTLSKVRAIQDNAF